MMLYISLVIFFQFFLAQDRLNIHNQLLHWRHLPARLLYNDFSFRLFFHTHLVAFRIKSNEKDSPIFSQVSIYEVPLNYQKCLGHNLFSYPLTICTHINKYIFFACKQDFDLEGSKFILENEINK